MPVNMQLGCDTLAVEKLYYIYSTYVHYIIKYWSLLALDMINGIMSIHDTLSIHMEQYQLVQTSMSVWQPTAITYIYCVNYIYR